MSSGAPIAIIGPTAVGKTAYAIALAQQLCAEIISVDSRQIYQQMDIGTAKPTLSQRQAVPHHLVDIVPPDAEFSLATFLDLAHTAAQEIAVRGRLPLFVGGTGQYLAALIEGWQVPHVPPQLDLRAQWEHQAQHDGPASLYQTLQRVDPVAAEQIGSANTRRLIRALEVWEMTGTPISQLQTRRPPEPPMRVLWLDAPRELLYQRIDQRVDQMMEEGLLAEVERLHQAGYAWTLPSMSSLGYIQFQPYIGGTQTCEACVQRLKFDTHAFARRQESWFRRFPTTLRVALHEPQAPEVIASWLAATT